MLVYLFARGKGYVSEMAAFFPELSRNALQNAAEVLEKDGVLVEGQQGNLRVYEFNPRCPYAQSLQLPARGTRASLHLSGRPAQERKGRMTSHTDFT